MNDSEIEIDFETVINEVCKSIRSKLKLPARGSRYEIEASFSFTPRRYARLLLLSCSYSGSLFAHLDALGIGIPQNSITSRLTKNALVIRPSA